jgi:PAS domain S-box-containing protein
MSAGANPTPSSNPESLAQLRGCRDLNSHTHSVQFYEHDSSFLSQAGEFISTALDDGSIAIVIATNAHREGLVQRMAAQGLGLATLREQGRYIELDANESLARFMVDGLPDRARFFCLMDTIFGGANVADETCGHTVVLGEMVALLLESGNVQAAIQLEKLWNDLGKKYPFSLRCAYPMSGFSRAEHGRHLLSICAEHSHIIPSESYTGLASEEERRRAVTHLQQRARALESEIVLREQIQERLQRREAELADFLENAVEGVQQVDSDCKIRWANRSLLCLLGYAAEEYVSHDLADFHVNKERFEEFWQKLMRREDIYDLPAEMRCKDGSVKDVLIHSNGLWEGGRFIHTRCFIRDVTDQKRLEAALRESEKLAATARLAAALAHEINNPLQAVTSLFYVLQSHPSLDEAARGYASLADKELRRIAHITTQMLAFHRHNANPVPLKLSEVLDSVVEMYEAKLAKMSIAIERQCGGAEEIVWGFPSELRQLFANLVGNAIEASGSNRTIRLHISNSPDWANPARRGVRVIIADSGSGIPHASRNTLFEPFFTTKGEGGTGLGLWVSQGVVQKHEGTIRFRSSVRHGHSGTVFSVFLPSRVGNDVGQVAPLNFGRIEQLPLPFTSSERAA